MRIMISSFLKLPFHIVNPDKAFFLIYLLEIERVNDLTDLVTNPMASMIPIFAFNKIESSSQQIDP